MHSPNRVKSGVLFAILAGLAGALLPLAAARAAEESATPLFATPEKALEALQEAVKPIAGLPDMSKAPATIEEAEKAVEQRDAALASADAALRKVFGPALCEIANPDPVQRAKHLSEFARRLAESATFSPKDEKTAVLCLGKENWPFAIPLVKSDGKWSFDLATGKQEILNRRIGKSELSAIEVCQAYVKAQRGYMLKDYDGNGVMEYAQRLKSTPGKKDGLYWETRPGEEESPFGPLVAQAYAEGYGRKDEGVGAWHARQPFHGYFFRILTRQGKHAAGGKCDYIINDHMVAGFAFIAWPAEWGNSGVMTFIVNQNGKVYQKNLGAKTAELADDIREYDPDETWEPLVK